MSIRLLLSTGLDGTLGVYVDVHPNGVICPLVNIKPDLHAGKTMTVEFGISVRRSVTSAGQNNLEGHNSLNRHCLRSYPETLVYAEHGG